MSNFETKVVKGQKIITAFKNLPSELLNVLADELYIGANDIRTKIIKGMQQTEKAPWWYWRGKNPGRKKHYPSAPGEMPAIDSGELISRIIADQRPNEIEVGVEAGAPYAIFLEDPEVLNRPFLQPTVDQEAPIMEKNIMLAIEKAAGDAFK